MAERNVRIQNVRDFTVQIRRVATDDATIIGTGIVALRDGHIMTCAHIVRPEGVGTGGANGYEVGVYFPQARDGEKDRRAAIVAYFPKHDIALLQLIDGPPPLAPEQMAVLGRAENSVLNSFRTYGYRPLGPYLAGTADGTILGLVGKERLQLETKGISVGMSGAAVLDIKRNLVVGLISEIWHPGSGSADDISMAATFAPFYLLLRDTPLPKQPAPQPKFDIAAARQAVAPAGVALHGAPPPLAEWVGRRDLLQSITDDWTNPDRHVTGLIGFGGEGKTSLARRWLDDLLSDESQSQSDGVFWWGFYDRPNVDEFFEAALNYMGGGKIDPRGTPSANARAQVIGAMLGAGRYLFVLDGLEIMQHQDGDRYGLLRSNDLRDFLRYFAAPGHQSFCLVTSRAPLLDLMVYDTYTHRDVIRLSPADGRALLRTVGVQGDDEALDQVVADWDGHALTLSLLGGQLVSLYGGDVARASEIDPPTADESRYERVHRILRRYDEHLTDAERTFLMLFSAFRTPVHESAFTPVFRARRGEVTSPLQAAIAALDDTAFNAMIQRLLAYRILRHDPRADVYTAHPLIRNHYLARLTAGDRDQAQNAHARIKDYYLELAGDMPRFPTMDDLAPLIEAVHHACRAGAYDEAWRLFLERIDQRQVLLHQFGAYETQLALMIEFFPDGDTAQEPQVSDPRTKGYILNQVGLCLMSLGRLGEAVSFYERANMTQLDMKDWRNASIGYQNLAELHTYLGVLAESADAARESLALARRAESKQDERTALALQAWAAHLRGDLKTAGATFRQAEVLVREIDHSTPYLYSLRGIQYADHLRRTGNTDYARRVTEANLEICERNRWAGDLSRGHRVLGDLDADEADHESARAHYDEALKIARSITFRPALIEALLARGRWAARNLAGDQALSDLNEALGYAVEGGYRIYQADAHVGLAWAHLAEGRLAEARGEAERARELSVGIGYRWGQVDADEVLEALGTIHTSTS